MSISSRIREERERLRYTQTEFAALVGSSKRTQMGWEHERSFPDAKVLEAWYGAGVDAGYIVTGVRADSTLEFPVLNAREQALIENFSNASNECKEVIEAAAKAAAMANLVNKPRVSDILASVVFSESPEVTIGQKIKG